MDIDVAAELFLKTSDKMEQATHAMISRLPKQPVHKVLAASGSGPASGTLLLLMPDNPAPGKIWFISRVGIFGSDPHTTVAGVCDIYAGPGEEPTLPNCIYNGLAVPTIINEGRFHNPVQGNEQIYAIVNSPVNGQPYTFTVVAYEYNAADIQGWTL